MRGIPYLSIMSETWILVIIISYFALLFVISLLTGRKANEDTFFRGNRSSPWYLVAFGMIGASLSGVTFISVPGWVGTQQFAYMQMVLGYLVGYGVIAFVLMPLYYRLNLTSIYKYLETRFGTYSYKTGASFFLLSRVLGASFRLYLVALVLDKFVLGEGHMGIPFWATVAISIALIWVYTFRGGIKTVVWTDTLQTLFMLLAAGMGVYYIAGELGLESVGEVWDAVDNSQYSQTWFWDWESKYNFFKQFLGGAFIAIVMTGLDQDMMQKNLTCKTLGDAQKNMMSFSVVIVVVNLGFLILGALVYMFAMSKGLISDVDGLMSLNPETGEVIGKLKTDELFPQIALEYMDPVLGVLFVLGLIAAAYSSADSALTALTTSVCIDFLDFEKRTDAKVKDRTRRLVHIGVSVVIFIAILIFNLVNDTAVIGAIFSAATYTYGPLLGLYAFGLFTKFKVHDQFVPVVCILSPILIYVLNYFTGNWLGFATLIANGGLTFLGLLICVKWDALKTHASYS